VTYYKLVCSVVLNRVEFRCLNRSAIAAWQEGSQLVIRHLHENAEHPAFIHKELCYSSA
jgi:hypothetical protein